MKTETLKLSKLKGNPSNPRVLRDDKFLKLKASIEAFPDMLQKRPIVAVTDKDGKYMVLGGNMRLKACADLGMKEVPVILADEWTEEQRREFIIKDNVGFGEWDWDQLANEWDAGQLTDWGLDAPGFDVPEIEAPALSDADKPEFQQMAFLLHDSQAETVKAAVDKAKQAGASESDVNENGNANALAYICADFLNG
jgi:ParB-like chromosome segregation protein Spo0J